MSMRHSACGKAVFVLAVVLVGALALGSSVFAANFHINEKVDALENSAAEAFVGGAIGQVTADLGSPSMVRDNLADAEQIDYIFIGEAKVYTFAVAKAAGKSVTAYVKHNRAEWEESVYPAYPA